MLGLGTATAVVNGGASAIGAQIITSILNGNFNPDYKKEARKQMRYIQQKYSLAYGGGLSGEDPCAVIQKIDPNSKLLMNPNGTKPVNPFPDERSFEDSLQINFHPVSGHQGRFVASHAMASIGAIIDYQNIRRARTWIPGISSPGKPNDYINMFLEESKVWLRTQLTMDSVHADELRRRADYYTKLKNDNYYWCFPIESDSCNIHKVIDFVHDKVQNAYEVVSREEKNKSLQTLFKELNDHTTNAFEFGKLFLAYLLYTSNKAGSNLLSNVNFDGKSYETGKLHRMLEQSTELVFKTYMDDMQQTHDRLSNAASGNNNRLRQESKDYMGQLNNSSNNSNGGGNLLLTNGTDQNALTTNNHANNNTINSSNSTYYCDYIIDISEYEESSALNPLSSTVYSVEICDPKGYSWVFRKQYSDFESLHKTLCKDSSNIMNKEMTVSDGDVNNNGSNSNSGNNGSNNSSGKVTIQQYLNLPSNKINTMFRKKEQFDAMCDDLKYFLIRLLSIIPLYPKPVQTIIAQFMEVKHLIILSNHKGALKHAETVPNLFVGLKKEFTTQLVAKKNNNNTAAGTMSSGVSGRQNSTDNNNTNSNNSNKNTSNKNNSNSNTNGSDQNMSKAMILFRKNWGIEWILKIFEAYSLLQRMATLLGWTLEINHFFVSMFGNTLTFSKLPLREIIMTQKDILSQFLIVVTELYQYACKLNMESQYKWHKNLQMTEHELSRVKHHVEQALSVIAQIDTEHLDYQVQMRRLQDVHARFQPLMSRVDGNLASIQGELGLPSYSLNNAAAASAVTNNDAFSGGGGFNGNNQNERKGYYSVENEDGGDYSPAFNNRSSTNPHGLRLTNAVDEANYHSDNKYNNNRILMLTDSDQVSRQDFKSSQIEELPADDRTTNHNSSNVKNNNNSNNSSSDFVVFSRSGSKTSIPTKENNNPLNNMHYNNTNSNKNGSKFVDIDEKGESGPNSPSGSPQTRTKQHNQQLNHTSPENNNGGCVVPGSPVMEKDVNCVESTVCVIC